MKYCPNARCRHRLVARSQAEYLDHVERCHDCGSTLVAEPGVFVDAPARAEEANGEPLVELDEDELERSARIDIMTGAFVVVACGLATVGTFLLALRGGVYLVVWGPMVFGVIRLNRGLETRRKLRKRADLASGGTPAPRRESHSQQPPPPTD